jgi:hypothetical protein
MKGSLTHYKDDTWHYTIDDHPGPDQKRVRKKFSITAIGKTFVQKKANAQEQAEEIWRKFRFWEANMLFGDYLDRFLADGQKKDANGNAR